MVGGFRVRSRGMAAISASWEVEACGCACCRFLWCVCFCAPSPGRPLSGSEVAGGLLTRRL